MKNIQCSLFITFLLMASFINDVAGQTYIYRFDLTDSPKFSSNASTSGTQKLHNQSRSSTFSVGSGTVARITVDVRNTGIAEGTIRAKLNGATIWTKATSNTNWNKYTSPSLSMTASGTLTVEIRNSELSDAFFDNIILRVESPNLSINIGTPVDPCTGDVELLPRASGSALTSQGTFSFHTTHNGPTTFPQLGYVIGSNEFTSGIHHIRRYSYAGPAATVWASYYVNGKYTARYEFNIPTSGTPAVRPTLPAPTSVTYSTSTTCSETLTATLGTSYRWFNGGTLVSGGSGRTLTPTTTGNYYCEVTKTGLGCDFTYANTGGVAVDVTTRANPTATISETSQTICEGETPLSISVTPSDFVSPTYQWKEGTTIIGTSSTLSGSDPDLAGLSPGTHTITCRISDGSTCYTSTGVTKTTYITVNSTSNSQINGEGGYFECSDGANMSVNNPVATVAYALWRDGSPLVVQTIQTQTSGLQFLDFNPQTVEDRYTVRVGVCTLPGEVNVSIIPSPDVPVILASDNPTDVCPSDLIDLTVSEGASGSWARADDANTPAANRIDMGSSQTIIATHEGYYWVTVGGLSCQATQTIGPLQVTFRDLDYPNSSTIIQVGGTDVNGVIRFCNDGTGKLEMPAGGSSYEWDKNGVFTGVTGRTYNISSSDSEQTMRGRYVPSGTSSCEVQGSIQIKNATETFNDWANAYTKDVHCGFVNLTQIEPNLYWQSEINGEETDYLPPDFIQLSPNAQNQNVYRALTDGIYWTRKFEDGCWGTSNGAILVDDNPSPEFTINEPLDFCSDEDVTVSIDAVSLVGPSVVYWFLEGTSLIPDQNTPTGEIVNLGNLAPGDYDYLVKREAASCDVWHTASITVTSAELSANPVIVIEECDKSIVRFNQNGLYFQPGSSSLHQDMDFTPDGGSFNVDGDFEIGGPATLYVRRKKNDCWSSTTETVTINNTVPPTISINTNLPGSSVCYGSSVALAGVAPGAIAYRWYQEIGGGNLPVGVSAGYGTGVLTENSTFHLEADFNVSSLVCTSVATITIPVVQETEVPNDPYIQKVGGNYILNKNNTDNATYKPEFDSKIGQFDQFGWFDI